MKQERRRIIESNEISEIYTFRLGGYEQKVLVEGRHHDLPVVITLHGGPGTPIPFSVGCRGMFPMFTEHFIMVYWDQLGCGINNYPIDDSFTIHTFVDMACDLISEIRRLFPNNNILIFSTSWGSVMSASLLDIKANDIRGVVACGQIIKDIFFCKEVYHVLEQSRIPKKKLDILRHTTSENATPRELQLMSSCLNKYTDAYHNKKGRQAPMASTIRDLLASPDYSFQDFKAVMMNGYRGNTSIWKELLHIDLSEVLARSTIPYIMLQGDTDIVASTKTVIELVEQSGNSNLNYCVVKDTGHFPGIDMMNKLLEELLKLKQAI